jgi:hypothetical protein
MRRRDDVRGRHLCCDTACLALSVPASLPISLPRSPSRPPVASPRVKPIRGLRRSRIELVRLVRQRERALIYADGRRRFASTMSAVACRLFDGDPPARRLPRGCSTGRDRD